MKKILSYTLIMALAVLASCNKKGPEPGEVTMPGVFYADIPGDKSVVEIAPGASKTYSLKACAFQNQVTDIVMNFSFKADPDGVDKYNQAHGTSYVMCPGSAFEFLSNDVMLPRYGQASTTARIMRIMAPVARWESASRLRPLNCPRMLPSRSSMRVTKSG